MVTKFCVLAACVRFCGGFVGAFAMKRVQKKYVRCFGFCLIVFADLFIYCGAFFIVASRVFSHTCRQELWNSCGGA